MSVTKRAYPSLHSRAWRNLMVAATNAALDQGHITLRAPPAEDRQTGQYRQDKATVFHFTLPGGVKGVGAVREIAWDEIGIHSAVHLTDDADRWITSRNANFFAGKAFASGWLERRGGLFLQSSIRHFACRKDVKAALAAAEIEAMGYRDHGLVIL